ncbi:reverse transcriptase domain, reverse transcriptase zinc-binding domain protein [Tanacetum coccineum]|uniref:Reverse transcriptase domain, reverse transcriptase zinc-binding domain protein n=1 Tax=Tanacetum coccineum TaxID=301880 RepID=A0ABQ5IBI7_9ASTR
MKFQLKRGVRQGDPLSPFLFIIAAEGLHVAMLEAMSRGRFNGIKILNSDLTLSHLQFADDVIFMGEWSQDNAQNLVRILRCFYLSFGLKINLKKSKLFGVGVPGNEVSALARKLVCEPSSFPFTYLGLPVGASMSRSVHWQPIIDRFSEKLSSWKAKNVSFGGRLTLGGAHGDSRKISWIAWDKVLSSSEFGGLNIGCLKALNWSLLAKWPIRSGREESELNDLQHEISSIILSSNPDSWRWLLRWNNLVPGKINILAWRIRNYRLPTRANIDKRGIDIHSILCPFCEEQIEDEDHIFALYTALNVLEMADDGDLNFGEKISSLFDVVVLCAIWWMWRARNLLVFQAVKVNMINIIDDIIVTSCLWIKNKAKCSILL